MLITQAKHYEELSQLAVTKLLDVIHQTPHPVICLATGASCQRMYELFVQIVNEQQIDISHVTFVKLDEWVGVPSDDPCTCSYYLQTNIFQQLHQPYQELVEMKSDTEHIEEELQKMDAFLQQHPLDLMILGLGMDGHLGLNEPSDALHYGCHKIALHEVTKTHTMLQGKQVNYGMSIGMQGIFEAKQILMLVCGERKEEAYQGFMSKQITTQLPASFLWLHPNCDTIVALAT